MPRWRKKKLHPVRDELFTEYLSVKKVVMDSHTNSYPSEHANIVRISGHMDATIVSAVLGELVNDNRIMW
jgi:hypothetical protein